MIFIYYIAAYTRMGNDLRMKFEKLHFKWYVFIITSNLSLIATILTHFLPHNTHDELVYSEK